MSDCQVRRRVLLQSDEWLEWYDSGGADDARTGRIAGIVAGIVFAFVVLIVVPVVCICRERCRRQTNTRDTVHALSNETSPQEISTPVIMVFDDDYERRTFPTPADVAALQREVWERRQIAMQEQYSGPRQDGGSRYVHGGDVTSRSAAEHHNQQYVPDEAPLDVTRSAEDQGETDDPPAYGDAIDSDIYMRTYEVNISHDSFRSDGNTCTGLDEELPPHDPSDSIGVSYNRHLHAEEAGPEPLPTYQAAVASLDKDNQRDGDVAIVEHMMYDNEAGISLSNTPTNPVHDSIIRNETANQDIISDQNRRMEGGVHIAPPSIISSHSEDHTELESGATSEGLNESWV